ncbi:MAG: hypothetical protein Q9213_001809 [Squamulea squamosa]
MSSAMDRSTLNDRVLPVPVEQLPDILIFQKRFRCRALLGRAREVSHIEDRKEDPSIGYATKVAPGLLDVETFRRRCARRRQRLEPLEPKKTESRELLVGRLGTLSDRPISPSLRPVKSATNTPTGPKQENAALSPLVHTELDSATGERSFAPHLCCGGDLNEFAIPFASYDIGCSSVGFKANVKIKKGLAGFANGINISALADTGSRENVISASCAQRLGLVVKGTPSYFELGNSRKTRSIGASYD